MDKNVNEHVVEDFGKEWSKFNQCDVSLEELSKTFNSYFALFPWDKLTKNSQGFDLGCGSGRWAQFCAPHVGILHCIDPSIAALEVAQKNLSAFPNCLFHNASVDAIPLDDNSMDFGYSLGVLDHVPDTKGGIESCVKKLKPGSPFLIYLFYAFDNRPLWFKAIWRASDILRRAVCALPYPIKYAVSQIMALLVYLPFSMFARVFELLGSNVSNFPLSFYRNKSFYTMRTDALDRFGSRLEHRFSRSQIETMMLSAGLEHIEFSDKEPFWSAIGYKADRRNAIR